MAVMADSQLRPSLGTQVARPSMPLVTCTSPTKSTIASARSTPREPSPRTQATEYPAILATAAPATAAELNHPVAVAVDTNGNLFIADWNNSAVRRVDGRGGVITTVAGTGTADYSGDGGPATRVDLNHPYGVSIDSARD